MTRAEGLKDEGRELEAAGVARRELARVAQLLGRRVELEVTGDAATPWGRGVAVSAERVGRHLLELMTELRAPVAKTTDEAPSSVTTGERSSPFAEARSAFDLRRGELDAVCCALAVEVDERFGRIFGFLNDHAQKTRPTLGLAASLAAQPPSALLERPLFARGLLVAGGDGPLPEQTIRLDADVVRYLLTGTPRRPERDGVRVHEADATALDRLILPAPLRAEAQAYVARAREAGAEGSLPALLVTGAEGLGRRALARAIFGALGLGTVEVEGDAGADALRVASRELAFSGAALLTRCKSNIDASVTREAGARAVGFVAPVEALTALAVSLGGRACSVIEMEEPGVDDRSKLYRALIGPALEVDDGAIDALAAKVRFGPRVMNEVARRAAIAVAHDPRASRGTHARHLADACRVVGHGAMEGLAQRLPTSVTREDLVVPDKLREELDFAVGWIRHQRTVFGGWKLDRRLPFGRGLAALFAGGPGTGKTLAAQVLAAELEMLAYRVDLSQVVSKYIGETEKNLKSVFDRAREAGAILFFDEADALFGKRSEVKEAHDRYANMEVGYLLQRIEAHDGVTVLATNRLRDLDPAFVRRFQIIADFPLPGPAERERIWAALLRDVPLASDVDLARVARDAEVAGGEIKNAVVAAAFFAARDGDVVKAEHLRRALVRELLKSGKVADAERLRGK